MGLSVGNRYRIPRYRWLTQGGGLGIPTFNFNPNLATFTAKMAKRTAPGPFATAPIVQGKFDGSGTPDALTYNRGTQQNGAFYSTIDPYQGTLELWWTPEKDRDATDQYQVLYRADGSIFLIYRPVDAKLWAYIGGVTLTANLTVVAGTTYNIAFRWDSNNTIDGTNYGCISVNDTHTFGATSVAVVASPSLTTSIGSTGSTQPANGIIEGLTIYRRVLGDGTYGTPTVAGVDELNLIYAAGAGKKPEEVCPEDIVFAFPTNGTAGQLSTGTGEAWNYPWGDLELEHSLMEDGGYLGGEWGVKFNGTSTEINLGNHASIQDLHSGDFTVETWVRCPAQTDPVSMIINKGFSTAGGWRFYFNSTTLVFLVELSTTNSQVAVANSPYVDGKLHHLVAYYDSATKISHLAIDGVWKASGSVGAGTPVTDIGLSAYMGRRSSNASYYYEGLIGWTRISDNDRYSHGTDFVPSRTPPSNDGNTVRLFLMDEGTGTTIGDSSTNAQDGTLSNGTWEAQWNNEGTPVIPTSLEFNGSSTVINHGSGATLDDLPTGAGGMTIDGWIRVNPDSSPIDMILSKETRSLGGWDIRIIGGGFIQFKAEMATTDVVCTQYTNVLDGRWHYFHLFYNDATKTAQIGLDGQWTTTAVGAGAYQTDASYNLLVGLDNTNFYFNGAIGWLRISNNDRLGVGVDFTPEARTSPPSTDANTIWQINMDEGAGTTVADESGNGNDGTITDGVWNNTPDMAIDAPGARIFNWGYVIGSDAADDGFHEDIAVSAGEDYHILAMVESDGIQSQPKVTLYDVDGAAEIASIEGSAGEGLGDTVYDFCGEVPAGCSTMRVLITNSAGVGEIYVHKVFVLPNLVDNGGMEGTYDDESGGGGGTVNVAPGWNALSVETDGTDTLDKETTIVHSGAASQEIDVDANAEGMNTANSAVFTNGTWYLYTVWLYGVTGNVRIESSGGDFLSIVTPAIGAWTRYSYISNELSGRAYIRSSGAAHFYVDDISVIELDDVSITATAASEANSAEGTGLRVDGLDTLTQPIVGLGATSGKIRFNWTPRHAPDKLNLYGVTPTTIFSAYKDGSNFIQLVQLTNDDIRLYMRIGGVDKNSAVTDVTGVFSAGTTYLCEIEYSASEIVWSLDGTPIITTSTAIDFGANIPDTFYAGADESGVENSDAVFSNP